MSFMDGYTRDVEVTHRLAECVRRELFNTPSQRLGQILINLSRNEDLWNVRDEEWIERLGR